MSLNIMTKRIGLFGGTFDPIHTGHLLLAETARESFNLDLVLFWPNPAPYHRAGSSVSPLEDRINMTRLALSDNPYFEFSDFEIKLEGDSYTSKTLELFHEENPGDELFFIMGGDSLFSIEYWKNPEKIFSLATILTGQRSDQQKGATGILHPDYKDELPNEEGSLNTDKILDDKIRDLREKFGAQIYNLHAPEIDISSGDIRKRVKSGASIRYLTPRPVEEYIYEKRLYL